MTRVEQLDWSKLQPKQDPIIKPRTTKEKFVPEYIEYTVKVKDHRQNTTQVFHQWARNRTEANEKALRYLYKSFKHTEFEIV